MSTTSGSREEIAKFLRAARKTRDSMLQPEPASSSPASRELQTAKSNLGSPNTIERVIRCNDLWLLIASDQLYGLGTLVSEGRSVLSPFPLVRSVIEHSVSSVWLLDPTIDQYSRAIRAALAVLRSEEEMTKATARMAGRGSENYTKVKKIFKATQSDLRADFGDLQSDPWSIDGIQMPQPTELVKDFGTKWEGERAWMGTYDYLCATANHPSLSALEFVDLLESGPALHMPADFLNRLVRAAVVPFIKAMEHFAVYMGWSSQAIDTYIDSANETLGEVIRDRKEEPNDRE